MNIILQGIKIIIISILSIFYWPLNTFFLFVQKHYSILQREDRVSFYIATPLYYILFVITAVLGWPLEAMGEAFNPLPGGFR